MKFKYEVADIFGKFKAWVETQSGCKMQGSGLIMELNIPPKNLTSFVKMQALNIS